MSHQMSADDLSEEIVFTRTLLDTLDTGSTTYAQEKADLEQQLRNLEAQYEALEGGSVTYDEEEYNSGGAGSQPGLQHTNGDYVHRPQSSSSLPELDLPRPVQPPYNASRKVSGFSADSRKRQRNESLSAPNGESMSKSRRTSPSPLDASPATPDSIESLGTWDQRIGGITTRPQSSTLSKRPSKSEQMMKRELERQREMEQRAEQAKQDREFAERLSQGLPERTTSQNPTPSSSSARLAPIFHRPSSQTPQPQRTSASPFTYGAQSLQQEQPAQNGFAQYSTGAMNATPYTDAMGRQYPGTAQSQPSRPSHPTTQNSWAPRNGHTAHGLDSDEDDEVEVVDSTAFRPSPRSQRRTQPQAMSGISYPAMPGSSLAGQSQPMPSIDLTDPFAELDAYYTGQQPIGQSTVTRFPSQYPQQRQPYGSYGYNLTNGTQPSLLSTPLDLMRNGLSALTSNIWGPSPAQQLNATYAGPSNSLNYDFIDLDNLPMPNRGHDFADEDDYPSWTGHARDSRFDYMYSDPTKTKEEIEALLKNIQPDQELPPEMREGSPEDMSVALMEHQKVGLTWLKNMEEGTNKGGILADDMGLGKTVQTIALIVSRKSEDTLRKTTLIIAPVALMRQWEREIKDKVRPGRQLKVHVHHGQNIRKATFKTLRQNDVVLTTYGTLASELKRKDDWARKRAGNPNLPPEKLCLLGDDCLWYRVVLDEAQCIKNKNIRTSEAACLLQSVSRFCLTGTPMMNGVVELYSLIRFLRIGPYNELNRFNQTFTRPLKSGSDRERTRSMNQLHGLLKAIMLRRTKNSKIDGKPIIELPERTTEVDHAVFDDDQADFYKALETKSQLTMNKYLKAGTVGKNYSNILVLLLRLRQAACHPHLIKDFGIAATAELTEEQMIDYAKELAPAVVARIKETNGNFECPVCYDGVENPAIFVPCGHDTCSECYTKIADPQRGIAEGRENGGTAKCPECREMIDPKRVIDYTTFKKVFMGEGGEEGTTKAEEADEEDSETEDEDDADSDDAGSLKDFIVEDGHEGDTDNEGGSKAKKPVNKGKGKKSKVKGKGMFGAKDKPKKKAQTLAELKREGQRNKKAKARYLKRLRKEWITSAKIDKTLELLEGIHANDPQEKTIIFSQFTSFLDLLEVPLADRQYGYQRYDGSMNPRDRQDAINEFMDSKRCKVMLMSLKAGNAGLNLNKASQVIILDPFWNPYIEEQAIGRAHRIGQLSVVKVHRVLIEGTVEDRIVQLQDKKRELIDTALDENGLKNISRLGVAELKFLFGLSGSAE